MLSKTNSLDDIKEELKSARVYGFEDKDVAANTELINQSGYQDVPLLTSLTGDASGLSATTAYSLKINGTEYDITTASTLTNTAIILLINAQITGVYWAKWVNNIDSTNNGLRFINDATGVTSAIAHAAGTTNTDLFATLTNWSAFATAVAGKNNSFEEALVKADVVAERDRLVPKISQTTYDTIEALDKTGLTDIQTAVYWSSIYYTIAEFYLQMARDDKYSRHGQNEDRSDGKVTRQSEGMTGHEWAAVDYLNKAKQSLSLAGYATAKILQRRNTIHALD